MCFVDLRNFFGVDNNVAPIPRHSVDERTFGVTLVKRFPPYVFSINGNALLIHKIARVECHWWKIGGHGHTLIKALRPRMIAKTVCQQTKFLDSDRARTCRIPEPSAVLCGVCHGDPATFGKHGRGRREGISKEWAHVQLGCVVKGY